MANELKIFENEEFGKVRTVEIDGSLWFVGKDISECFGDTNYRRSLARIEEDEKGVSQIETRGGTQNMTIINESGLYSLLFYMQPKKARGTSQDDAIIEERIAKLKKFKHWVTSEVLPSIRKNGGYIYNQENKTTEEILASAYVVAMNVINEKQALIEKMQPKADFFDAVAESSDAVSIGEVAKVLKVKGVGRNKLFEFLRQQKVLDRHNIPYQKYINCGWFRTIEQKYDTPDGETHVSIKTLVYQKGVDGIRKLLESKEVA